MLAPILVAAIALAALAGCAVDTAGTSILSGGAPRAYVLAAAAGREAAPRPLVVALHGWLGTPDQMAAMTGLSAAAARRGVAVVYPKGAWRSWSAADSAFLADVVEDVSMRLPVDPTRIYVVGFSSGGFMAQAFACSGRVRLAGVVVVASGLATPVAAACQPRKPVPFLLIQGTADPVVSVSGTRSHGGPILPAWETLVFWATENRCRGFDQWIMPSQEPGISILRAAGRACRSGAAEAWFILGGGHDWPGGNSRYPELLVGRRTGAVDATSVALEFLLRHAADPAGRRHGAPVPGPRGGPRQGRVKTRADRRNV